MPPEPRFVPRFAAEPPQELLPFGRRAERLAQEFLAACLSLEGELGEPGAPTWYPDRTWDGRTYVPVTCRTSTGLELYGVVSYVAGEEEPEDFAATADWTEETIEANPDWTIDLCDEVVGAWRGDGGTVAAMTLIWGVPVTVGAAAATAELGGLVVDQCRLVEGRFTLLGPDDLDGHTLEVALHGPDATEVAREPLWADDGEDDEED